MSALLVVDDVVKRFVTAEGDVIACLDVFDPEPIPVDSPVIDLPNVVSALSTQQSGEAAQRDTTEIIFFSTDGQGRIVDAKNCIVVMTSNLGAEFLARPTSKDGRIEPQTRELVMWAFDSLLSGEITPALILGFKYAAS